MSSKITGERQAKAKTADFGLGHAETAFLLIENKGVKSRKKEVSSKEATAPLPRGKSPRIAKFENLTGTDREPRRTRAAQEACRSHYWIERGKVRWAPKWSEEQIAEGRRHEQERRRVYYQELYGKRGWNLERLFRWLKRLWNRKGSP